MTIIWAKKIGWQWNLFADDCVSIGDYEISASNNYRRKIRDLPRAPRKMFVATAWSCRQVDVVVNSMDRILSENMTKKTSALELKDLLQQIMLEVYKEIKAVDDDAPNTIILLLDIETDTCYMIEWYAVNIISENVECTFWSWDDTFYKLHKIPSKLDEDDKYISNFVFAAIDAPWCWLPVYQVNKDYCAAWDEDGIIAQKSW